MGFTLETGVPVLTVFLQGILSFFSPCVLPLVPLYVSYLAGGAKEVAEDGTVHYPRGRVLLNTLFFVLGISFTFFLLGFGFTALGRFFSTYKIWFARISGIIMIVFGLYQFGIFGRSAAVEREHRLPMRLDKLSMNPLTALLFGFTFSFAWTPCVGPTLSSVLLMASSAASSAAGYMLIGVYTLGFVLPFLAVGLFTGAVLDFFKRHQTVVKYTIKVGAVLLVLMGVMTLTGFMNGITGYLSTVSAAPASSAQTSSSQPGAAASGEAPSSQAQAKSGAGSSSAQSGASSASEHPKVAAPDFVLKDQYGNTHKLSDYKGKTVFLNFWATWCPPCRGEMPDIEALYKKYGGNTGDLIVLGVANPKTNERPSNQDVTVPEVQKFLTDNKYTFPVVMDTTGEVLSAYGISAFPTTFMIDAEGNVFGYASGALTADIMESVVQQTMTGKRA